MRVRLLVRKHVEQTDGSVRFEAAFLAKDQQRTGTADLQVMRQQESNGLAHQRSSHDVSLHVTQLQSSGTELQTDMDAFTTQLSKTQTHTGIFKIINNNLIATIKLHYIII